MQKYTRVKKMWKRLDVTFTLKSPLHIGYLPSKGSVISRTRYYVPGKNLWGAVTKRATEALFDEPAAKDYFGMGKQIKENFRFGYFYVYDEQNIYIPKFTDKGLKYGEMDGVDVIEFEHKFIGSRVLTAIDGATRTARYESLHEIEFINNKYINLRNNIRNTKIIGCMWCRKECELPSIDGETTVTAEDGGLYVDGCNLIEELTLGGEQNYGFGSVKLESTNKINFPIECELGADIKVFIKKDTPISFHLEYSSSIPFYGEVELMAGRGYFNVDHNDKNKEIEQTGNQYKIAPGEVISEPCYYFSPGTVLKNEQGSILQWNGIMQGDET